jgi:hypothetical protein
MPNLPTPHNLGATPSKRREEASKPTTELRWLQELQLKSKTLGKLRLLLLQPILNPWMAQKILVRILFRVDRGPRYMRSQARTRKMAVKGTIWV